MEIHINIAMVDVKVKMNDLQLNERETKILEVLLLNMCAQTNAQVTKGGMALNPLRKTEESNIFHQQLAWQQSITSEQYEQMKEGLSRRITNAIKMCELPEVEIDYKENAYLNI
ncbi:hypothetical protein ACFVAD_23680 [Sutcliffiella sp. NPDC057660]|uniref:hypothetical protein n=1 Tax=Sutcliffiella sp. NPDC057660 TaxID=3346199 RepID=UPI0036B14CED